jgi:hypothetical protein
VLIERAIDQTKGNYTKAAKLLGNMATAMSLSDIEIL